MKNVKIYVGSFYNYKKQKGKYYATIVYKDYKKIMSGYEDNSTYHRNLLLAILKSLYSLKEPCDIKLFTSDKYVVFCFEEKKKWAGSRKLNQDLIFEIYQAISEGKHKFKIQYIEHIPDCYIQNDYRLYRRKQAALK